jgi:hypothetical protein
MPASFAMTRTHMGKNQRLRAVKKAAKHQTRAQQLFQGQGAKKNQRKIVTLEQWVEVEIHDGETVTKLYPSNEELIKRGQEMDPPPEMVYRRLNFRRGVPVEYEWATSDPEVRKRAWHGIQRMGVDTWLEQIEQEKKNGSGHLEATDAALPRPESRGGCECRACTAMRLYWERRGVAVA